MFQIWLCCNTFAMINTINSSIFAKKSLMYAKRTFCCALFGAVLTLLRSSPCSSPDHIQQPSVLGQTGVCNIVYQKSGQIQQCCCTSKQPGQPHERCWISELSCCAQLKMSGKPIVIVNNIKKRCRKYSASSI